MVLTKGDIVNEVMRKVRLGRPPKGRQQDLFPEWDAKALSKRRATDLVDAVFEILKGALERGDNVLITGFGKFKARFKWARKGRDPRTGKQIILDSRRVVTFQSSQKLRKRLNQGEDL